MLDQVRARVDAAGGIAARSWLHAWFALAVVATVVLTLVPVTPSAGVYGNGDGGSNNPGYWMVGRDGSVYTFGLAAHFGDIPSTTDAPSPSPVVSMSAEPNGRGYVLLEVEAFCSWSACSRKMRSMALANTGLMLLGSQGLPNIMCRKFSE